jgi:hypothetical protein
METDPPDDLFATPTALLHDLLAVSLAAVDLLRPLYGSDGTELVDFIVAYVNPAAQRLTGLPERPNVTIRSRFPALFTNGVFDFYRRVFETGEAGRYDFPLPSRWVRQLFPRRGPPQRGTARGQLHRTGRQLPYPRGTRFAPEPSH